MSRSKGNAYEEQAVKFLEKNGFEIVDRNFYAKWGEIDIVAKKDGIYHFVEVKGGENFEPIYNITPQKLQKNIKAVLSYAQKKGISSAYCIDALIVKDKTFDFVENITL